MAGVARYVSETQLRAIELIIATPTLLVTGFFIWFIFHGTPTPESGYAIVFIISLIITTGWFVAAVVLCTTLLQRGIDTIPNRPYKTELTAVFLGVGVIVLIVLEHTTHFPKHIPWVNEATIVTVGSWGLIFTPALIAGVVFARAVLTLTRQCHGIQLP